MIVNMPNLIHIISEERQRTSITSMVHINQFMCQRGMNTREEFDAWCKQTRIAFNQLVDQLAMNPVTKVEL